MYFNQPMRRRQPQLNGVFDVIGSVLSLGQQNLASRRQLEQARADAAARQAEAQAQVQAAQLALQAEQAKQQTGLMQTASKNKMLMLGGGLALFAVSAFLVMKMKKKGA